MENFNSSAYPVIEHYVDGSSDTTGGFTKLEKAALMIAGNIGVKVDNIGVTEQQLKLISEVSVAIAKAVLEEANK